MTAPPEPPISNHPWGFTEGSARAPALVTSSVRALERLLEPPRTLYLDERDRASNPFFLVVVLGVQTVYFPPSCF
jgi:hypothetical protein